MKQRRSVSEEALISTSGSVRYMLKGTGIRRQSSDALTMHFGIMTVGHVVVGVEAYKSGVLNWRDILSHSLHSVIEQS